MGAGEGGLTAAEAVPALRRRARGGGEEGGRLTTALLLLPTSLWFLLLLVAPLVILVVYSFGLRAPAGGYEPAFTLEQYAKLPTRAVAFRNTAIMSVASTLLCILVAFPLAYFLATKAGRWKTLLLVLVIVPFWTSFLIRTYAWLVILGSNGIPALAERLGIAHDLVLLNTPFAVMLGIVYNYLPLTVFPIYVSLERLDKRLLEASRDLGAPPWRTLWQVTVPLAAPGIITGALLVFILLSGEYVIPAMLGGNKVFLLGNALVDLFIQARDWPLGSAVAVSMILGMLATIGIYMKLTSRWMRGTGRSGVSLI
ncbi:Putrescine transport system permease protein PotH [bacterium HR12]|nr:Putrescine transport system permease protein PotH [bacterium HR12]